MIRLELGAGSAEAGWTSVDRYDPRATVRADFSRLPYPDGSVDHIRCSHGLEHVGWREVPGVLAEWRRVLCRWGTLWLMVPDLDYACRHWLDHEADGEWSLMLLFGSQEHEGQYHRCGFDRRTLHAALVSAGFEVRHVAPAHSHGQGCLVAEAFVA